MSKAVFQAGGPLPSESSTYIPREADEQAVTHLRRMEYITLVEPRQHGKTSLINRLIRQFSSHGYTFAIRDLMAAKSSIVSSSDWYVALGNWLLRQLPFITRDQRPALPTNSASWEDFLAEVAEHARIANQNVVIVLDEIGALPSTLATDFFSVIRSVYTSRENLPFWRHLTFIIAGAFNPQELIQDRTVSNFNVDQRILLPDFDLSQVGQLVAHLRLREELSSKAAELVHYWTDGQPYLTQWLCLALADREDVVSMSNLNAIMCDTIESFFQVDTHHLARIKELAADPDLLTYVQRITKKPRARLSAALNDKHFRLAHVLGVIKADVKGLCQIRNRIYERALEEIKTTDNLELQSQEVYRYDAFISYSHTDRTWVRDTLLPYLDNEGLHICIDYRDFEPGVPSLINMENAIEHSRKTLLILTPNWVASEWTNFEALLIQTQDPAGRRHRFVPLMVQPCTLPLRLQTFTYLDFTDPREFDSQMRRLTISIRS